MKTSGRGGRKAEGEEAEVKVAVAVSKVGVEESEVAEAEVEVAVGEEFPGRESVGGVVQGFQSGVGVGVR